MVPPRKMRIIRTNLNIKNTHPRTRQKYQKRLVLRLQIRHLNYRFIQIELRITLLPRIALTLTLKIHQRYRLKFTVIFRPCPRLIKKDRLLPTPPSRQNMPHSNTIRINSIKLVSPVTPSAHRINPRLTIQNIKQSITPVNNYPRVGILNNPNMRMTALSIRHMLAAARRHRRPRPLLQIPV